MEYYGYIIVFAFGTIIGSFLNVVLYRLHTGRSVNGRSHCLSCAKGLRWYELLPLVSYAALRGRCGSCGSYIPVRYFLVELTTGVLFTYIWYLFSGDVALLIIHLLLITVLVLVFVYDLRHTIIPNEFVLGLIAIATFVVGYESYHAGMQHIATSLLGGIIAAAFFWGIWLYSKGRWIGLGDAKLALPLGAIVGLSDVFSFIVVSFWIGAFISLMLLLLQYLLRRGKRYLPFLRAPLTMKSEVPFAPFLIFGFLIVHLFSIDVFVLTYEILFW